MNSISNLVPGENLTRLDELNSLPEPQSQDRLRRLNPSLTPRLLEWYASHARPLPWRRVNDAYAIWVAETMLQQTRVETVIPYFERWLKRFPSLAHLAAASEQEVLSLWEGLGYYQRARNLHRASQMVMSEYGGELPREVKALRRLPGIGRYTAAAIASIAYHQDEPALDGNARRVLARFFAIDQPLRASHTERLLQELASAHLPRGRASEYNQALMDLGATLCTPRKPACPKCPLADHCLAHQRGQEQAIPAAGAKPALPHHTVTAAVIVRDGQVLIAQRPAQGLLGGLWEFPGGKQQPGEDLETCLQREIDEELGVRIAIESLLGMFRHAYTHFRVTLYAFRCTLMDGEPRNLEHAALQWVTLDELARFPMGKLDRQIAHLLNQCKEDYAHR